MVEEKLFELFAFALKAPRKQAAIVYYRCSTIDARLNLADELIRSILPRREKNDGGQADHFRRPAAAPSARLCPQLAGLIDALVDRWSGV